VKYESRASAGAALGARLVAFDPSETTVCGIPRGGAVVGARAAIEAGLPYECLVVCKIGMPCFPDVTLGAIDEDGEVLFDPRTQLTRVEVARVGGSLLDRIKEKVALCRGDRDVASLEGRTAVIVDELVADPILPVAALKLARKRGADRVILATPAITTALTRDLSVDFDDLIALETPSTIRSLSDVYRDAADPSDREISERLNEAWDAVA
jgi:putative phosphoribosyl transferase